MIPDAEELFAKLEQEGEPTVRTRLAQGVYGQQKTPLVIEWLHQKEQSRADILANENLKTTKSAHMAAWVAACAAVISALAAIYVIFKS
ncbi:MAG: hypothetical protein IPK20_04935 [Betaproteobacteria bacterium]|nr:hypothetical protein [Betaproteobacteria bacterium]